jgi:hypothetical protein
MNNKKYQQKSLKYFITLSLKESIQKIKDQIFGKIFKNH